MRGVETEEEWLQWFEDTLNSCEEQRKANRDFNKTRDEVDASADADPIPIAVIQKEELAASKRAKFEEACDVEQVLRDDTGNMHEGSINCLVTFPNKVDDEVKTIVQKRMLRRRQRINASVACGVFAEGTGEPVTSHWDCQDRALDKLELDKRPVSQCVVDESSESRVDEGLYISLVEDISDFGDFSFESFESFDLEQRKGDVEKTIPIRKDGIQSKGRSTVTSYAGHMQKTSERSASRRGTGVYERKYELEQ